MLNEKKINKSGGITLPAHVRKSLGISEGEKIKIEMQDDGNILLKRIVGSCIICGSNEELIKINDKYVCKECLDAINVLAVVDVNEGVE